jgi:anthranilate/para-aminobenzoate synthase component II
MKVLVINDGHDLGYSYYRPFERVGEYCTDPSDLQKDHKNIALVVFTGGEDVSPELYGQQENRKTFSSLERDMFERSVFLRACSLKLPIMGICRGAQFLCVMAKGALVQHLNGHGVSHTLRTDDGRLIRVNSTHHQMQLPPRDAVPLAWAEPKLSQVYENSSEHDLLNPEFEYDCVWYPKINAVGMQYHPEAMEKNSEGFNYAYELYQRFFGELRGDTTVRQSHAVR